MALCGGLGTVGTADTKIKDLIVELAPTIREQTGLKTDSKLEVISYKSQIVAGVNYFVKIKYEDAKYMHLRIYKHFSGSTELTSFQLEKALEDEITHF